MKKKFYGKNSWYFDREIVERLKGPKIAIKVKEKIYSRKSPFQKIEVMDTEPYGKILVLDKILQLTQKDEFIYHEMLVHLPMFYHPDPKKILIIGGGDGGALREVLKHPINKVYLVEIDKEVIEVCRRYLPFVSKNSFNHNIIEIFIDDGIKFIKNYHNFFDIIIIDATDPRPRDMAMGLFSVKFYKNAYKALKTKGVLSIQSGWFTQNFCKKAYRNLKKVFPFIKIHQAFIPCFSDHEQTFSLGSKKINLRKIKLKHIKKRFQESKIKRLRYYSPEIHLASGILPTYLKEKVTEHGKKQ